MGRPIKKTESSTVDTGYANGIGGTIGAPYAVNGVYTIDFQYADATGTTHANGFARKQRSKNRFDVSDSSSFNANTTITLVNSTDGNIANLTANTGWIVAYGNATYKFYAKSITSKTVTDWNGNRYVYDIQRAADATYGNVATN
jgi:hypothetical protein